MRINPFMLERCFAEYEFKARYLLSPSDCETMLRGKAATRGQRDPRLL